MMLRSSRTLTQSAPLSRKRLFSQASTSSICARKPLQGRAALTSASAIAAAGGLWYVTREEIHNDAVIAPTAAAAGKKTTVTGVSRQDGSLATLVWGSNKNHLLSADSQIPDSVRTPAAVDWLQDIALRDIALQEKHAACIDANGDVYQWGDGFFGSSGSASSSSGKPVLTLRGKNVMCLQATADRVFALSASGRIYALAANQVKQELSAGQPIPSSNPWWGTGWFWGEEEIIDFAEIMPQEKLGWNERFVSISAGKDHILALTNTGRTFAHPINLQANAYGQLGMRKVDVPDHSHDGHPHLHHIRKQLDLTPKAIADPYAKSTPAVRRATEPTESKSLELAVNDSSIHFSDRLFEVPALEGVKVDRIAAGARSSFVLSGGRVLGWGANEFGQIGLGGNVTLAVITVPTEVILWRTTPRTTKTTCLDIYAGGDLAFFKVERVDGTAMPFVDVLACGNGQWGGLGNNLFSNGQGTPVRARNVSGLMEYDEGSKNLQPIYPHQISVSPDGHVLLTLETLSRGGPGGAGRDLLVWGANQEFQLGNGKRGSLAVPTALHALNGERVILGKRRADIRDMKGKVWKKGVQVEQCAVAGWGNSVVYWRICR
ncbi:uncharacterized protein PHACADRAFT_121379 [Phanerochaete carnosa HHB-10118-sp]|uniref:RCC1/BLIP-II protein n=1 Tax=Phanerochaete carnosa (strain HHB-10118-sp) TaxID=650164 RepID=K5WYR6_PHACS|nr:uncharacterized protein PHACADRAFT_121379 [Phanerochaete carnosa HHB-10118-sp]EKM55652.1 hypothetical protein PHACADRAFT_121379 [Phanerochaete carnosa HHB-10118-sp]